MDSNVEYYNGMEVGVQIVKDILALSSQEREERFGKSDVAAILDDFDFEQMRNIMSKEIVLSKRYVIRAIRNDAVTFKKRVVGESLKYTEYPSDELMLDFWGCYPDADFIVVEQIYIREFKK